jgi:hypothetical protein
MQARELGFQMVPVNAVPQVGPPPYHQAVLPSLRSAENISLHRQESGRLFFQQNENSSVGTDKTASTNGGGRFCVLVQS